MAEEKSNAKDQVLKLTISQIEKSFGKGAIMRLGEEAAKLKVGTIPTGSLSLDLAIGVGGVPRGRVVEIYGPESSGKTTLSLSIISQAQKAGGVAAFIDAEHALDPTYSRQVGVDIDNLLISQPDSGEQALEITDTLVRSGAIDVIVIDSVAALVPKAELEGEVGDLLVGAQARLMSQALRKLTASISKSKTCVIFINQIRMMIGVKFGSPETTPGGKALKFYASLRLDTRRIQSLKRGEEIIGGRIKVKVAKNKVAPPFRVAEFDMMYEDGISFEGGLVDLGIEKGIIEKSGAWLSYHGEKIAQGRENAKNYLKENKEVAAKLEKEIKEKLGFLETPGIDRIGG